MDDSLNICLSCGLCCNGTLFGFVQLGQAELPVVKELMHIEEERGNAFFLQPCDNYCDGCSIYSDRPNECVNFSCGLLDSFEKKEVSFDSALGSINMVKQTKLAIEKKLEKLQLTLKSESFYFQMVELKIVLQKMKSQTALTQKYLELEEDILQLNSLLLKDFGASLF
jgi:uncharacterized protein